ncbi:MAG: hypothetical protein KKB20_02445 [Proteobacteria bacterium]|nr:hypothetical protein [Pseudomonadota bacterium]
MELNPSKAWIENARAAARVLRSRSPASAAPPAEPFLDPPSEPSGLRSLEETQSPDELWYKGRIVDRWV